MAYNLKTEQAAYYVKLTAIGRQLLSQGALTFQGFAIGDSEVDYQATSRGGADYTALRVLRPVDNQADIKYPVSPTAGVTPIAPLTGKVAQQHRITNQAPSRGFFRAPTPQNPPADYYLIDVTLPDAQGHVTTIRDTFGVLPNGGDTVLYDSGNPHYQLGDWLLVHWFHPGWGYVAENLPNRYALAPDAPGAYLLYRILGEVEGGLQLDRPVPRFAYPDVNSARYSPAFVIPGGDAIEEVYGLADPVLDWDEDQLAFVNTSPVGSAQVGLWNCNIVYGEQPIGAQLFPLAAYPSNTYAGARRYLGYPSVGSPIALLHYSNHVVHNLYGEALVPTSVQVTLSTVLWWANTDARSGLTVKATSTRHEVTGGASTFQLAFHILEDEFGHGVGRVFPSLKLIALDDKELVTALSAKSNRNWTLPPFDYLSVTGANAPTDLGQGIVFSEPLASTDIDPTKKTLHITYALLPDETQPWDASQGYGFRPSMPCQYVTRTPVALAQAQAVNLRLSTRYLQHFQSADSPLGAGYTAQRLVLLFQETITGVQPQADRWIVYDMVDEVNANLPGRGSSIPANGLDYLYQVAGAKLLAARQNAVANNKYFILDALGSAADGLTLGEETVLLGNVATDIESMAFRTSFLLNLPEGSYATSSNPTWQLGQPVAITELGIYDVNNSLVAIAKPTDPIVKIAQQPLFLDISLDF